MSVLNNDNIMKKAFSTVELSVAILVIAVFVLVIMSQLGTANKKAGFSKMKSDINMINGVVNISLASNNHPPDTFGKKFFLKLVNGKINSSHGYGVENFSDGSERALLTSVPEPPSSNFGSYHIWSYYNKNLPIDNYAVSIKTPSDGDSWCAYRNGEVSTLSIYPMPEGGERYSTIRACQP